MTLSFSIQVGANTNTISRIISLAKILCHVVHVLDMDLFLLRKQDLMGKLLKLIQKRTRPGVYGNVGVTKYNVEK